MSKDIGDVTIHARKLKLENLLDSVTKHAPKSYVEPAIAAMTARTLLYKTDDTLFKADIPAYLVKGESFTYTLKRDTAEKPIVNDLLEADSHHRVLNFSCYPQGTNLLQMLERRADNSVSTKGFYAVSGWDDSLRYHVIIPRKFHRNFLSKMVTTKMDDDTIMAYEKLTILRKGWVLEEAIYKATTAPRELVKAFWKTKSYNMADSLMTAARAEENAQKTYSIKKWEAGDDGRYCFTYYQAIDNLMLFSGNLFGKKKDELRDYTFGYELKADDTRQRSNDEGLKYFSLENFFRKDAGGKIPRSGVTVSDTY